MLLFQSAIPHRLVRCSMRNIRDGLAKMARGMLPVLDTDVEPADFERGLARLKGRQVFGKVIVTF
jgi:alcohol dehydrogenase